jgi:hypothetical protein
MESVVCGRASCSDRAVAKVTPVVCWRLFANQIVGTVGSGPAGSEDAQGPSLPVENP